MAKNHAGYQAHDDTRYRKAGALEEPDSNVIGGFSGDALRIGARHLAGWDPQFVRVRQSKSPERRFHAGAWLAHLSKTG
jgi:hypothetical protein